MNSTINSDDNWDSNALAIKYDETMSSAQQRHRDEIRRIERERKDLFEQQKQEIQTLRNEQQTLKDKLEQLKTRNTVLSNEIKTLREQLKTSLDKSQHDDELVSVLLKQQQQTKLTHEQLQKDFDMQKKINTELEQTNKLDQMKQTNMIKQLQLVVDQKETKIRELEMHLDENKIDVRLLWFIHFSNSVVLIIIILNIKYESVHSSQPCYTGNERSSSMRSHRFS